MLMVGGTAKVFGKGIVRYVWFGGLGGGRVRALNVDFVRHR